MRRLKLFSTMIVILLGSAGVLYGQYIEDCGLLEAGVEPECLIFNSNNYGDYELVGDSGDFGVGNYVWIGGYIDSGCASTCMVGACLHADSIRNCCDCEPGNANGDHTVNIYDITRIINFLYLGGPPPEPYALCSCDMNLDGYCNVFDVTHLICYLYLGSCGGIPSCEWWIYFNGPPLR